MAFYFSKDSRFAIVDTETIRAQADDSGFTDEGTAANNDTVNDMTLLPAVEEIGDAYYFGAPGKFGGVLLNLGTSGVGDTITWEYYNGSYTALTLSDETSGFTASTGNRLIAFDPPSDWATDTINGVEGYWIRARCSTANFSTTPVGTQAWLVKDLSSYIISVDGLPGPRELIEVTALTKGGRTFIPGLENGVITLELQWSEDTTAGPDTVLGVARTDTAARAFDFGPEGRATGDIKYSGTCWVRNFQVTSRVGAQVTARCELQVEGTVSRGTYD